MQLYNNMSYKTSKLITQSYSTSFSIAVSFLDKEMQQAIYSIYGFVRFADEIVDTFQHIDQTMALNNFERDYYEAIKTGVSLNPVLHSFALTVKKYNIPPDLIDPFLKSMRADLFKSEYNNKNELSSYIYGSADVVGLMCLMVFTNGDEQQFLKLKEPAMKLGSAFQKVNFLRDLKTDTEGLGRCYFPELRNELLNETSKRKLITDIESDFNHAKTGIAKLPGKSKLAVLIAYMYFLKLLTKLKQTPASKIMKKRIRVSGPNKFLLLTKACFKYYLNLI